MEPRSVDDARRKWRTSVINIGGEPCYIVTVNHNTITYINLKTRKTEVIPYSEEPKLKPWSFRLGFVNFGEGCVYLYRKSMRQFSSGLTRENVGMYCVHTETASALGNVEMMLCAEFAEMLEGAYPTVDEALRMLSTTRKAVAIDRQFCLAKNGRVVDVMYKKSVVGALGKNKEILLFDEYNQLYHAFNSGK